MKRYLIITEDYGVYHTDDRDLALSVADSYMVYDTETLKYLDGEGDEQAGGHIEEYTK